MAETAKLLSDRPLFFLISSYTTGLQPGVLKYLLSSVLKGRKGVIEASELGLPVSSSDVPLPCGAAGRFTGEE